MDTGIDIDDQPFTLDGDKPPEPERIRVHWPRFWFAEKGKLCASNDSAPPCVDFEGKGHVTVRGGKRSSYAEWDAMLRRLAHFRQSFVQNRGLDLIQERFTIGSPGPYSPRQPSRIL